MGLWDDIKSGAGDAWDAYLDYTGYGNAYHAIKGDKTEGQTLTEADRQRMLDLEAQMSGRAPSNATFSDVRKDQQDLMGRLRALSEGRGPSLAQEQMRQSVDRATNQQFAMAAGARGNPALAQRQAMNQSGAIQSSAAGQSALARAAEQLGALSQLGGVTGQARGQDDAMEMFNAGQQNQFQLENDRNRLGALSGAAGQTNAYLAQPSYGDKFKADIASYLEMYAKMSGGGG